MGRMLAVGATSIGRVRQNNEDSWLLDEDLGLAIVADGMGGEACGEVASALTVRAIQEYFAQCSEVEPRLPALRDAIRQAHQRVVAEAQSAAACQGMGSTVVAAAWDLPGLDIASVGDSRAYLLRGGHLRQITIDQNLGNQMRQMRGWTDEQVANFPQRNILTAAIGASEELPIQQHSFLLEPGDRILLCSDGLYGPLGDESLAALLLAGGDLPGLLDKLIQKANEAGGPDNITAILLELPPV